MGRLESNLDIAYLVEANVLGLLTEALTAKVEVVLADETGSVLADAAVAKKNVSNRRSDVVFDDFAFLRIQILVGAQIVQNGIFGFVPATRALAVGLGARVPDAFVRHDCGCVGEITDAEWEGDFTWIRVGVNFV